MSIKAKIWIVLIAPVYISLFIAILLFSFVFRLFLKTILFLGILTAFEYWLLKSKQIITVWEFRKNLHKVDREAMDFEE